MTRISDQISINHQEIQYEAVRSSGPGGQHVNKVSTAVVLKYPVSPQHFPDWFIRRLKKAAGRQMSKDGILIIKAQNYRSQARNKKTAFDRLVTLFTNAAKRPKPRKKSKVPKRAIESRLKNKKIRSQKKQLRKSPDRDDE
mgnify:FL=1